MRLGIVEVRGGEGGVLLWKRMREVCLGEKRDAEYAILMLVEELNRRRDRREQPQSINSTNRSG